MINFIIYEDEEKIRSWYITMILKLVGKRNNAYRIIELDHYDEDDMKMIQGITGKKIFILDIEVPGKSGLDFAREVRQGGDWLSQIIVVTSHDKMVNWTFRGRMLMLDFISKYNDCETNLVEALNLAYQILTSDRAMTFQTNGEVYQVAYKDILYIEKNTDGTSSTIVLKDQEIEIKQGIAGLMEFMKDDIRFLKTHRSCIVNVFNVTSVNLVSNTIYFGEHKTDLLSRDKKKILKEKLANQGLKELV